MSTIRISASPAEYREGHISVRLSLGMAPPYHKLIEATKLSEIEAAVREARTALAGQDMMISVYVKQGRKPNGFDAWKAANRSLFYVHAEEAQS